MKVIKRKTSMRFLFLLLALVFLGRPDILPGALAARLLSSTIFKTIPAVIMGNAQPRSTVQVNVTGPRAVAPAQTQVATNGFFRLEVGPFPAAGRYTLHLLAAKEEMSLALTVIEDTTSSAQGSSLGQAIEGALTATNQTLDSVDSALGGVPGNNSAISQTRSGIAESRPSFAEAGRSLQNIAAANAGLRESLRQDPNTDPEALRRLDDFSNTFENTIREQSRQLLELGREAAKERETACLAVAAALPALEATETLWKQMEEGVREYFRDYLRLVGPAEVTYPGAWEGGMIDGQPTSGIRPPSPDSRPLARDASGRPSTPQPTLPPSSAYLALNDYYYYHDSHGPANDPWPMQRVVNQRRQIMLEEYLASYCMFFKGTMSGHTHVEALEATKPFYALDNDWDGNVTLTMPKPINANDIIPLRGSLSGMARNFKATNLLRTLYTGRPGSVRYLTGQPSAARSGRAVFTVPLEGTVQGRRMSIKVVRGGVDYGNSIVARLQAIVTPLASPVPLVQTYDVPFQGGWWQVSRAIGPDSSTTWDIIVENNTYKVDWQFARDLSSPGALGHFTIKAELCSGCESTRPTFIR